MVSSIASEALLPMAFAVRVTSPGTSQLTGQSTRKVLPGWMVSVWVVLSKSFNPLTEKESLTSWDVRV
ncbi:hypothetical protein ES703_93161 [subsurface metagenome]